MQCEHKLTRFLLLICACSIVSIRAAYAEETLKLNLLDNGGFEEVAPEKRDSKGLVRIPWWTTPRGAEMVEERDEEHVLVTRSGESITQPLAAYAPLVSGLVVRGRMSGTGALTLIDGSGARATITLSADGEEAFEIPAERFAEKLGQALVPRFVVELSGTDEGAVWHEVEAIVELPLPTHEELRAEIVAELDWIFRLWLDNCMDDVGSTETHLACHLLDVVTGERLRTGMAGMHPVMIQLKLANEVEENEVWRAAVQRYLDALLTRCLDPATGLPRMWDPKQDVPRPNPVEIRMTLEFLLGVVENGPLNFRTRALQAVLQIANHVLENGVLPDGNVAASYVPGSGKPNTEVSVLRRLDVPSQLARLGGMTEQFQYSRAAREACVTFDYTNFWPGTWEAIDPGWDDNYGHYGGATTVMWKAHPEDEVFKSIAWSGAVHYGELWGDALRLGGNVAADQVRCWIILTDIARLEPSARAEIRELLQLAARSHFKGEQYGNGSWGDVTIYQFNPKTNLHVGDLPGTPKNLLHGLAGIYAKDLDLQTDELRAMFTAVMRSSRDTYKREFGYLTGRNEVAGANFGGGEVRLAVGLVEMLRQLSR